MAIPRVLAPPLIALLISGCATVTKGTNQTLTVTTDPAGAACELTRDGKQIATVDPTPGTARVGRSKQTIFVACRKAGFAEANDSIYANMPLGTYYGSLALGGTIGLGLDYATGAMFEYQPETVSLDLAPEEFRSQTERDAFFEHEKTVAIEQAEGKKRRLRAECKENCEGALKAVDDAKALKLTEIESSRSRARVVRVRN